MSESAAPKRAPAGLGRAGRRVWRETLRAVAPDWQLDERDLLVLEQAARQADLIADLEEALDREGIITKGAAGQPRVNGAVASLNQARASLVRLLGAVEISPPRERTGHLSGRQRDQLRDARRSRWPRGEQARG